MLLGFSGMIAGFNGSFEFGKKLYIYFLNPCRHLMNHWYFIESGATYPPELNYTIMRMFAASFGAWMVPLAYLTAVQLHFSHTASILAGGKKKTTIYTTCFVILLFSFLFSSI